MKRGQLEPDKAAEIFGSHLDAPLLLTEPSRASILETALSYDATVYDAVYLSLSLELGEPLLTAERSSTLWIKKLGKLAECIG